MKRKLVLQTLLFVGLYCLSLEPAYGKNDDLLYTAEVVSALQGNIGTYSQLASCPSRLRLTLKKDLCDPLSFIFRLSAASGKIYLGSKKEYVPINDIATDASSSNEPGRANLFLDRAHFLWQVSGKTDLSFGVLDIISFDSLDKGFSSDRAILDETSGFMSTHFLRPLALSFLEQETYSTIPAVGMRTSLSPWYTLRFLLTFGEIKDHIFFRNTTGFESTFHAKILDKEGDYRITIGFSDADDSKTHHISPCTAMGLSQDLSGSLCLFGRYSVAEDHTVSRMFSLAQWHYLFGLTLRPSGTRTETAPYYIGMGFSEVKVFDEDKTEKALEGFWRFNLKENIALTPDVQYILNPRGSDKEILIWAVRLKALF